MYFINKNSVFGVNFVPPVFVLRIIYPSCMTNKVTMLYISLTPTKVYPNNICWHPCKSVFRNGIAIYFCIDNICLDFL